MPALGAGALLAIYQLAQNGALTLGSFAWGWFGGQVGLEATLLTAAGVGLVLAFAVRGFTWTRPGPPFSCPGPRRCHRPPRKRRRPSWCRCWRTRGQIMEIMHYRVDPANRGEFLGHHGGGAAGAPPRRGNFWQLYDDVAHPEGWMELWTMESWTDHLREMRDCRRTTGPRWCGCTRTAASSGRGALHRGGPRRTLGRDTRTTAVRH